MHSYELTPPEKFYFNNGESIYRIRSDPVQ